MVRDGQIRVPTLEDGSHHVGTSPGSTREEGQKHQVSGTSRVQGPREDGTSGVKELRLSSSCAPKGEGRS